MMQSLQQFARYEAYQDSGVEWLGEIPQGWVISKLGSYFWERRVKVSDKDYPPLSVTKNGILPQLESAAKTNDGDNRRLVLKGDFVINSRSDRKGSSGIAKQDGSVSLINIVLQPINMSPVYCNYLMKNYTFIEEFYRIGHGIVADLWTTRYVDMKSIVVGIPPFPEQAAIANFLDQKTAEIDQAIALKADLIERLKEYKQITIQHAVTRGLDPNAKMKASGVEWIGDIPESWEVKKLKCGVTIQGGFAFQSVDFVDRGVQLLKISNLYMNDLCLDRQPTFLNSSFLHSHKDWIVGNGDILMSLTGTLGKRDYGFAILLNGNSRFLLNQRVARLRVSKLFQKKFLLSLLQSENYLSQLYSLPAGTKQANLSNEDVVNIKVPVPSLEEQAAIVAHIEAISAKIDQATDQAQQQINTLTEYKTVLINAAVTGKIKVTDDSAQGTRHAQ